LQAGTILESDESIKAALASARTVAVLGLSPKPDRDSHRVARYLQAAGYRIIPVRPAQKTILGEPAVASLDEIREPVDIVDVFRSSEQVPAHVPEAIRLGPRVFWMQLGIENADAAARLTAAGIHVVMNRCLKVAHETLLGKAILDR